MALVTQLLQLLCNEVHRLTLEGCCVTLVSIETGHLAENALYEMPNRHAGRNGVGIHNHVRHDSFNRKG